MSEENNAASIELATELTIAWLGNPNVRATTDEVPAFLQKMHATIQKLSGTISNAAGDASGTSGGREFTPAVTVRKSLASRDHIISMIDGKPYKTLRRHLSTHGLTPEDYRARYGLKPDYPMVAPSYSEHRRAVAKQLGLGQNGRQSRAKAAPAKPEAAAPRGRRKAAPKA